MIIKLNTILLLLLIYTECLSLCSSCYESIHVSLD